MFTKQHYEQIAQMFAETAGEYEDTAARIATEEVRNYLANEMADMFEEDNSRFNRKLFMKAAKADTRPLTGDDHGCTDSVHTKFSSRS